MMRGKLAGAKGARGFLLIALIAALLTSALGVLGADGGLRIKRVPLPGAMSGLNNVLFAFDRYALVAPFAPSVELAEDADLDQYDNNQLFIIDMQKLASEPRRIELGNCYFPTRLLYGEQSGMLFVRGTKYVDTGAPEYEPVDVIAQVRINLDEDSKPTGTVVMPVEVRPRTAAGVEDVPIDLVLAQNGKILVFSNGQSLFSYEFVNGYVLELGMVEESSYDEHNRITFVDVDAASQTLSVLASRREYLPDGGYRDYSDLRFRILAENGTVAKTLATLGDGDFPDGDYLTPGSNVVINSVRNAADPSTFDTLEAYFVTAQGWLCQVDLLSQADPPPVNRIERIYEGGPAEGETPTPRIVQFDAATRTISIVQRGHVAEIRRPVLGNPNRPGKIRRPVLAHRFDLPQIVLLRLNKKRKIVERRDLTDILENEEGVSPLIFDGAKNAYFTTYNGDLYKIGFGAKLAKAQIEKLAAVGSNVESVSYLSARDSFALIGTPELGEDSPAPASEMVVARPKSVDNSSLGMALHSVLMSPSLAQTLAQSASLAIRRPCNIGRAR